MIREAILIVAVVGCACSASAQPALPYTPPDRELWDLMGKAISDIPMSLTAHQQIQGILANVQREAQMREARAKAMQAKPPESEPPK